MRAELSVAAAVVVAAALTVSAALVVVPSEGGVLTGVGVAAVIGYVALSLVSTTTRWKIGFFVALALALFAPPLLGGQNGAPVRPEDVLVVGVFGLIAFRQDAPVVGSLERGLFVYLGVAAAAIMASSASSAAPASWSDFFLFIRLAKYALVIFVARDVAKRGQIRLGALVLLGEIFSTVFAAIGIAQYFGFSAAIRWFSVSSSARSQLLLSGVTWRRAIGSVGNPNYFGFLCALGVALAVAGLFLLPGNVRRRTLSVTTAATCLVGVFVSGSRTSVAACAGMILLMAAASLNRPNTWRTLFGLGGVALAGSFAWDSLRGVNALNRFSFLWSSQDGSLVSLQQRRAAWSGAISAVHGDWIFGIGPSKGLLIQWVDSDFVRAFRDLGVVGLVGYVLLMAGCVFRWTLAAQGRRGEDAGGLLAAAAFVGVLVMGGASDVFYEPQVMDVVLLLCGACTTTLLAKPGAA